MKTTFQVVSDKQLRKFNIELDYYEGPNSAGEYDPIEIKVDNQLYNFCSEWMLCKDRFKRDIIIHNKKLINCFITSTTIGNGQNIVELSFDYYENL